VHKVGNKTECNNTHGERIKISSASLDSVLQIAGVNTFYTISQSCCMSLDLELITNVPELHRVIFSTVYPWIDSARVQDTPAVNLPWRLNFVQWPQILMGLPVIKFSSCHQS